MALRIRSPQQACSKAPIRCTASDWLPLFSLKANRFHDWRLWFISYIAPDVSTPGIF